MTYCVGLLLEQGLVLASDTRSNAGVDQVAIVPKMHVFEIKGDRVIVVMTSGNLAVTQSVVNNLRSNIEKHELDSKHLHNAESMFEAAGLVGTELRAAARDSHGLEGRAVTSSRSSSG